MDQQRGFNLERCGGEREEKTEEQGGVSVCLEGCRQRKAIHIQVRLIYCSLTRMYEKKKVINVKKTRIWSKLSETKRKICKKSALKNKADGTCEKTVYGVFSIFLSFN